MQRESTAVLAACRDRILAGGDAGGAKIAVIREVRIIVELYTVAVQAVLHDELMDLDARDAHRKLVFLLTRDLAGMTAGTVCHIKGHRTNMTYYSYSSKKMQAQPSQLPLGLLQPCNVPRGND